MALTQHIEALNRQKAGVDAMVRAAEAHAWIDRDEVISLKLQRLHLKDEITRLRLVADNDIGGVSRAEIRRQ